MEHTKWLPASGVTHKEAMHWRRAKMHSYQNKREKMDLKRTVWLQRIFRTDVLHRPSLIICVAFDTEVHDSRTTSWWWGGDFISCTSGFGEISQQLLEWLPTDKLQTFMSPLGSSRINMWSCLPNTVVYNQILFESNNIPMGLSCTFCLVLITTTTTVTVSSSRCGWWFM